MLLKLFLEKWEEYQILELHRNSNCFLSRFSPGMATMPALIMLFICLDRHPNRGLAFVVHVIFGRNHLTFCNVPCAGLVTSGALSDLLIKYSKPPIGEHDTYAYDDA
jgi:hypothetical protein